MMNSNAVPGVASTLWARGRGAHRSNAFALAVAALLAVGCNEPAVLAPLPPLRAASLNAVAVSAEFAEALDRAAASDPARYHIYPSTFPGTPLAIDAATLVDSLFGRTVVLVTAEPLTDGDEYTLETDGVRTLTGTTTGPRRTNFRAGIAYDSPISDLMAEHCDVCHGVERAAGSYRTDSYEALFGPGTSSIPNVIAGNPACLLIVKTAPDKSMFNVGELTFQDSQLIRAWIVNYQARR